MKSARKIFLFLLGLIVVVDLSHGVLNAIFKPFAGTIDDVMHGVLNLTPFAYFGFVFWLAYKLVSRFGRTPSTKTTILLMIVLALELVFTLLVPVRKGSSSYHSLLPDFLGGIIIGWLTVAAAGPYLNSRWVRIVLTMLFLLWAAGGLLTDSLWYTEGCERGTGPLWRLPLLAGLMVAFAILIAFLGNPSFLVRSFFLRDHFQAVCLGALLVFAILLFWGLWRIRKDRLTPVAITLSVALLGFKIAEWAEFIAD